MAEEIEELKRRLTVAENERIAAEKSLAVIQSVFQTTMGKLIPHQKNIEENAAGPSRRRK